MEQISTGPRNLGDGMAIQIHGQSREAVLAERF